MLGLNCAFGPIELTETVRFIAENWPRLVSALPNAGLPMMVDGKSHFPMSPADFTKGMMRFVDEFGVNIVGGCCGTMPEHLKMLVRGRRARARRKTSRHTVSRKPQVSCLYAAEDVRQDLSYLIVAERTNTNGSRQFKRLLQEEDWDGLVSMARDEVRDGSHMLDVCVDFVGRDGVRDMHEVVSRYVQPDQRPAHARQHQPRRDGGRPEAGRRAVRAQLDEPRGGRGEARAASAGWPRRYGAAVVAGTIDEDKLNAMARTAERKISIARRIRDLAVDKYGLRDEDLLFDPLVLPISTGIEEDRRNALETIEGTRRISSELPKCHTVVGLSNVSFGLKPAARVVLNSAFLHELREAGLTGAIVHAQQDPPAEPHPRGAVGRRPGPDLRPPPRGLRSAHALHRPLPGRRRPGRGRSAQRQGQYDELSIEEKLKKHIIDGEKRDLIDHLDEALKTYSPLDIINNILLDGMKVVGELFGCGQMQLPFVLQIAETMKAAGRPPRAVHGEGRGRRARARSCSRPSRATSTTSARTSWTSSSPTTATRSTTSASSSRSQDILAAAEREQGRRDRHERAAGEDPSR